MTEYKGHNKPLTIRCKICGKTSTKQAQQLLYKGHGCNHCKTRSKGEEAIAKWLDDRGISYMREYTFGDLKDKGLLRYDFAVFDHWGNLDFLIEYDGEQHHKPVEKFGGKKRLTQTQRRDYIKTMYTIIRGINFIRIPYTMKSQIGEILTRGKVDRYANI